MTNFSYHTSKTSTWLQPLASHSEKNGHWLLTHETTQALVAKGVVCHRVSIESFMNTLSEIVNNTEDSFCGDMLPIWTSQCGNYSIMWHKEHNSASRLFVQHADDYYARIELRVNSVVHVAFQEPVWPHLQSRSTSLQRDFLSIPVKCLKELQADGTMPESANSANHYAQSRSAS